VHSYALSTDAVHSAVLGSMSKDAVYTPDPSQHGSTVTHSHQQSLIIEAEAIDSSFLTDMT